MFVEKKIKTGKIFSSDLIPELEHFFTTRETVLKSKEDGVCYEKNLSAVCEYLKINHTDLITPQQRHTPNVDIVSDNRFSYHETDALILPIKTKAIYLNFADCTPVILYDKEHNVGAIAHAGWRGTAGSISVKTLKKMEDIFNTNPLKTYAIIGPAIGKCCYEVDGEVIEQLKKTVKADNGMFEKKLLKYYPDLKLINKRQLAEAGLPEEQIDVCPFCTSCRNDLFFSYRRENGTTSRHSAVIKLR